MNFPRKRPQGQSGSGYSNNNNNGGGGERNNNQQRNRPRGGSNGGGQSNNNSGGGNRPRKNYGAMREKYLTQARDALSMGDRVLAENYFQHADHCFRMIAEETASRPQQRSPQQQYQDQQAAAGLPVSEAAQEVVAEAGCAENSEAGDTGDDSINMNVSSLPAFLTANYEPPKVENAPAAQPNWD